MSLRVLLADESPSIKKAFDLALKDFAVTVQTVHQGTDVLELFKSFKPDICFLDVLLPKKNGYDACTDIKHDGHMQTPIVLMWSNFMEVDEAKFKNCGANAKLEKPFETKTLREIVISHVPKVKQNKISEFLEPIAQQNSKDQPPASQDADADVPALESTAAISDNNGENLPDINDILDDGDREPQANSTSDDGDVDVLGEFDPTSINESSPPPDDLEDMFGGLELQDSDTDDEGDIENFSMEPLENFDPTSAEHDSAESFDSSDDFSAPSTLDSFETSNESSATLEVDNPETPSIMEMDSLGEIPPLEETSNDGPEPPPFTEDDTDTDPSISSVDIPVPPLPSDELEGVSEMQDFGDEDDEVTDPSISVADEPIISPPPPPAFEAQTPLTSVSEDDEVTPAPTTQENSRVDLDAQLSKDELKRLIMAQSKDIIESVVWEVVPELAKEMIKKEIERLTGELNPNEEAR